MKYPLHLTASSQFRQQQTTLSTFVTNKSALRHEVMKDFVVPSYSQTILKGSTFKGHQLFGPFPESFKSACLSSSAYQYKCRSRKSCASKQYGNSYQSKQLGSYSAPSAPPLKRSRPMYAPSTSYDPSRPFRFSSNTDQGRQSQSFPTGKGKGRGKSKANKTG